MKSNPEPRRATHAASQSGGALPSILPSAHACLLPDDFLLLSSPGSTAAAANATASANADTSSTANAHVGGPPTMGAPPKGAAGEAAPTAWARTEPSSKSRAGRSPSSAVEASQEGSESKMLDAILHGSHDDVASALAHDSGASSNPSSAGATAKTRAKKGA